MNNMHANSPSGPSYHSNGNLKENPPREQRRFKPVSFEFVPFGFGPMERLLDEALRVRTSIDTLEPRYRESSLQKGWSLIMAWVLGALGLLVSLAWDGMATWLVRGGIVAVIGWMHWMPVEFFVRGAMRSDAKLLLRTYAEREELIKEVNALEGEIDERLKERLGIK